MDGDNPLSGLTTTLDYDYAGRKTAMTDSDMGHWTYAYDALGNLTAQTDARGCTLSMTYDSLNRLTHKSSNGNCGTQVNITYGYDAGTNGAGRRTSMSDASGSTTWAYDARGRMVSETKTIDGHTFTTQWTYFSNDAVASMTYPDGEVVNYAYHPQGALSSVLGTDSYASSIRYDAAGRMVQLTRGALTTAYTFYPWSEQGGRLQRIHTGSLQDLNYDYDDVGNITSLTDDIASETLSFQYDALNRLTQYTLGANTESYGYDAAGRLAQMAGLSYTFDAAHPHAVASAGSNRSFAYDANGNMQTRTVGNNAYSLAYDAENHITNVSGDASAAYTYDGDGKMVSQDTPLGTTFYVGNYYEYFIPKTSVIGEVGQVNNLTGVPRTIILSRHYENPVVFALPHSANGGNVSVVRIKDVQKDRFTFYVQNISGSHTAAETVSYLVLEAGSWKLPDGTLLEVGKLDTGLTHSAAPTGWENVKFPHAFNGTPVVISQVQSNNDPHYVHTRQQGASSTGFSVALEEDDIQSSPHGVETVGWLAMQPASGTWSGHAYRAANTPNAVTHNWYTIHFSTLSQPRFLAWMPTTDGGDASGMRYRSLTASSVQVRVEEDTTLDAETNHTTEVVAYLVLGGDGTLTAQPYTPNGHSETKYYYAGAQRVATRVDGALRYLFSDHLGSTSLVTDANGNKLSEMRYAPWGTVRYAWNAQLTDYTYTGQRSMMDAFGLMYYNARWYDPSLGRFAQADTLIPGAGSPLAWDRYAYTLNNPLRYTDPSGHRTCTTQQAATGDETCDQNIFSKTNTNHVNPAEDVPLTELGAKIAWQYQQMYNQTDAWWWADGSFTLEEFLGMWIIHEAAGDEEKAVLIAQTIAQGLYVGHVNGQHDAACNSDACHNGLFNLMAAKANAGGSFAGGFLGRKNVGGYEGFGKGNGSKMGSAAQYGAAALHPAALIWHKNDAPHNWGNSTAGTVGLRRAGITKEDFGTGRHSIFYMQDNWLIYTPNQAAYWTARGVPITTVDQSP